LAGGRRKQEKRQDEQARGDIRELIVVHARDDDALESDQYHESIAEDVVVEGPEKLGRETGSRKTVQTVAGLAGKTDSIPATVGTHTESNGDYNAKLPDSCQNCELSPPREFDIPVIIANAVL
jgi:hypothetical protein